MEGHPRQLCAATKTPAICNRIMSFMCEAEKTQEARQFQSAVGNRAADGRGAMRADFACVQMSQIAVTLTLFLRPDTMHVHCIISSHEVNVDGGNPGLHTRGQRTPLKRIYFEGASDRSADRSMAVVSTKARNFRASPRGQKRAGRKKTKRWPMSWPFRKISFHSEHHILAYMKSNRNTT